MSVVSRKKNVGIIIAILLVVMVVMSFGASIKTNQNANAVSFDFRISDVEVSGGSATFTITRYVPGPEATISYRTVSGTAVAGTNFIYKEGSVTFEEGEETKEVVITVTNANWRYGTYDATTYTNIDKTFYLELYNVPSEYLYIPSFEATLEKSSSYEIHSDYFSDATFFADASGYAISDGTPYTQKIYARGGYYDLVADKYAIKISTDIAPSSGSQVFGITSSDTDITSQLTYTDTYLTDIGNFDYAIQIEDSVGETQNLPYTSLGSFLTYTPVNEYTYIYSQLADNGTSLDNGLLVINKGDFYFYSEANVPDSIFTISNISLKGKVIEKQAPILLGTSSFQSTYMFDDTLRISLIFDKVIDETNSDLVGSYFETTDGDYFNYAYGAGSNVLVFEGRLSANVIDEITLGDFNGSIKDFTGNEVTDLEISPFSITRQASEYKVEHYKISSTGYVLADTDYATAEIGESVEADEKVYSGFSLFEDIDTVASGIVLGDDSLVLKLYYKINTVYFDTGMGRDTNDGMTVITPVKTFAKAKELLAINGTIHIIYAEITSEEEWDLEGYGTAKVLRATKVTSMIDIKADASLTLSNITFNGNLAVFGSGCGSIINVDEGGSLIVGENTILKENNASSTTFGGAINNAGTTVINGGEIKNNLANDGGGIRNLETGIVAINDGTISGNKATNGGGIYNTTGSINFNGGSIANNIASSATGGGGGIYNSIGIVTISSFDAKIYGNTALGSSGKGGGILSTGTTSFKGQIIIEDAEIYENIAKNGGGLYITAESYIDISGGAIRNNEAKTSGGGIVSASSLIESTAISFSGGQISENIATQGGGLFITSGYFVMSGTASIIGNTVTTNGGGVYLTPAATFAMKGGSILENDAPVMGSGIYSLGNLDIENGTISGNTGDETVGGIANLGGTFKLAGETTSIDDIINLYYNKMWLTSLPLDERIFSIYLSDWVEDSPVVSGFEGLLAGSKADNFILLNDSVLLQSSLDGIDIILKLATYVEYNKNDDNATGEMARHYIVPGDAFNLLPNTYSKEKYFFLGWAESAQGAIVYQDEEELNIEEALSLYAVWQKTVPSWQDVEYVGTSFDGGDGTVTSPYLISNGHQLAYLAKLVNEGTLDYNENSYMLTDNIDLSVVAIPSLDGIVAKIIWIGIGNSVESFKGTFDGNGYKISGIYFDFNEDIQEYYGLFNTISDGATIKNVGLAEINIVGTCESFSFGAIAGRAVDSSLANVSVENINANVIVQLEGHIGGMIGEAYNTSVENFYIISDPMDMTIDGTYTAGGIAGIFASDSFAAIGFVDMGVIEKLIYFDPSTGTDEIGEINLYLALYDHSVKYNAQKLKEGEDLRFYRWTEVIDEYPVLEKVELRDIVYIENSFEIDRALGQDTVATFDEAIIGLAKDGQIIIKIAMSINSTELWSLPNTIFGDALVSPDSAIIGGAVNIGESLILRNITIKNDDDSVTFFYVWGKSASLIIEEGTTITGINAIMLEGNLVITDNESNPISIERINLSNPITLASALFSAIEIGMLEDADMVGNAVVQGDGTNIIDATEYIDFFTAPNGYFLFGEDNVIKLYEYMDEVYLDITSLDDGIGTLESPFNNFEKAKITVNDLGTIYVLNTIVITEDTSWNLTDRDVTLKRIDSTTFFWINNSATLTLTDFNVVGEEDYSYIVVVEPGATLALIRTNISNDADLFSIFAEEGATIEIDGESTIEANIVLCADETNNAQMVFNGDIALGNNFNIALVPEYWYDGYAFAIGGTGVDITEFESNFNLISYKNRYIIEADTEYNVLRAVTIKYSASFLNKLNGESFDTAGYEEQTIIIYDSIAEPQIPFRLGYEFLGWKNAADDFDYDFDTEVDEDTILYAAWQNYFATEDAEGTELSPFAISTYEQLQNVSYLFSEDNEYYDAYKDKYYKLENDILIDDNAPTFVPIGTENNLFEGTFDGNGYIIKNIFIQEELAAFIMINNGTITSLGITGSVDGEELAAGFAIANMGLITQSFNSAKVSVGGDDSISAGIAVFNFDVRDWDGLSDLEDITKGTISFCYNIGEITSTNDGMVFGISLIFGYIQNCYNAGIVDGYPITGEIIDDEPVLSFYSSDSYASGAGTALRTLEMVGENSSSHTNVMFDALTSGGNDDIWTQGNNDGAKWYYPQLAVFANRGVKANFENVYTITFEYDNGEDATALYQAEGLCIEVPEMPSKALKLFDGWYVVDNDEVTTLFDFENETIESDITLKATWVVYRYIIGYEVDEGNIIEDIEIAEGVTNLEITIPNTIQTIGNYSLNNENIGAIVFEENSTLEAIYMLAFQYTKLTEITLPKSLQEIYTSFINMLLLENIFVEEGSTSFKSIDGILYNIDETELVHYPYAKTNTTYEMPSTITYVGNGAFIGFYEDPMIIGNPYITTLILSENIEDAEDIAFYGLNSLTRIVITSTSPTFSLGENSFKIGENGLFPEFNENLVIELPSYTAYQNFMDAVDWMDFDEYYSYPLVIGFEYEGATDRAEETTRTKVDGDNESDTILNGMAMGTMPSPLKFGYDFVEWNTKSDASGATITATSILDADTTVYAIWSEWSDITIKNGSAPNKILVNDEEYEKTASEILAIDGLLSITFDNYVAYAKIDIAALSIDIFGGISSEIEEALFNISGSGTINIDMFIEATNGWFILLKGSDNTRINIKDGETIIYIFDQSDTSDITFYIDKVVASLPNEESNIYAWNTAGSVGRNMSEISLDNLPTDLAYQPYCPIAKGTITIIDTTSDKTYNANEQGASYTTSRDTIDEVLTCNIDYYGNEEDMLLRQNELISVPITVGTYYYVIYRIAYGDYCDADDINGSFSIEKATITINAIEDASINKTFDGETSYDGEFELGTHYECSGIIGNNATVTIDEIKINNANVDGAAYATVYISISDTDNYQMVSSFVITASISPLSVEVQWDSLDAYVYNASDRGDTVSALYVDINDDDIDLDISFSGKSTQFKNVGEYTATASNIDTNYTITNATLELEITKAIVSVTASNGVVLNKTFDGLDTYTESLIEGTDYTIEGIVDGAFVTIGAKTYNSSQVLLADTVTVVIAISDTDNYAMDASFDFAGSITPLEVAIVWSNDEEYTYTGTNQGSTVTAIYEDINGDEIAVDIISFSGTALEFNISGAYTATAQPNDDNYLLSNTTTSLYIAKALVTVEAMDSVVISKIYNGDAQYLATILWGTHYSITGIVDEITVIIGSITFNSSEVSAATEVLVNISLSDNSNYTMASSFVIDAEITPLEVLVVWEYDEDYTYNSTNQSDTISATFENIEGMNVPLSITYSGQSTLFVQAGDYLATASTDNTNYSLLDYTLELVISKATVEVVAMDGINLSKYFDGNATYGELLIEGEHYVVIGITDDAYVTITSTIFNSANVVEANKVVAEMIISDTDNYQMVSSFVITASISPLSVEVQWDSLDAYVYNASDRGDTVSALYVDINDDDIDLDISFSGKSTQFKNVGEYTATASNIDTNYTITNATLELEITKAIVSVTASNGVVLNKTFDGLDTYTESLIEGTDYTIEGIVDGAFVTIGAKTYNSSQVLLADTVTVVITISDTDNYAMDASFDFAGSIYAYEIDVNWMFEDSYTYNGANQGATITATYKDIYENDIALEIEFSGISETFMIAGDYIATTIPNDSNYLLTGTTSEFSISKALITVTQVEGVVLTKIFDGSDVYSPDLTIEEHYLVDGLVDDVIVLIGDIIINSSNVVGANIATVAITLSDASNYQMAATFAIDAEITPREVLVVWKYDEDYTYNGDDQGSTVGAKFVDVEEEDVALAITFSGQSEDFETAGSYVATASMFDTNYTLVDFAIELVIAKAQGRITADGTQTFTYDGEIKNAVATLNHNETNLVYDEAQGYINANEEGYIISITAEETANYLADSLEVTLRILKATIDMSAVSFNDRTFTYDGTEHSIYLDDITPDEITTVIYNNNNLKNVGSISVVAKFVYDTINYNVVEDMTAKITVVERTVYINIADKTSIFGKPLVMLTCGVTNLVDLDELSLLLTKEDGLDVGSYEITGEINNYNYIAEYTNGSYTITKAIHDMTGISFNNINTVYNANVQGVYISGTLPEGVTVVYTNNTARTIGTYAAVAEFIYDDKNFETVLDMEAVLTINKREITVTFSNFENIYADETVKTITATLNNIPATETAGAIAPIITYNKTVMASDYYTATVTINNNNYKLVGTTTRDFIVYKQEIEYVYDEDIEVIAIYNLGFLPETTISVTNVSQRTEISTGLFSGKESKQTFDITITDELLSGRSMTMMLLIGDEYRFLENLRVAKLDVNGNMIEIESVREDNYLIFEVYDTEGTYVIIGDGKGLTKWVIPSVAGSVAIIALAYVGTILNRKRKLRLRSQIIGVWEG